MEIMDEPEQMARMFRDLNSLFTKNQSNFDYLNNQIAAQLGINSISA
jgi:hypothetical protein